MTNCIGYVRVSTERQAGEDRTSLDDQKREINAKAAQLGLTVGEWFVDAGASGGDHDRPEFQRMYGFCTANPRSKSEPGALLALGESRFSRSPDPHESAYWKHVFSQLGWTVRYVVGDVDNPDLQALMDSIHAMQARKERIDQKIRTTNAMRTRAENGYWSRKAPFGYRRMTVDTRRVLDTHEHKRPGEGFITLAVHEEEAAAVCWCFEAYASGATQRMLQEGLRERTSGRKWPQRHVAYLLTNDTYLGRVRYRDQSFRADSHPAIVGQDLFDRVQKRLTKSKPRRGNKQASYLLSGFLRCPHCDGVYVGGGIVTPKAGKKVGPREQRYFYREKHLRGECGSVRGTVLRHLIEDAAIEELGRALSTAGVQAMIAAAVDQQVADSRDPSAALKELAARERKLEEKRSRFMDLYGDGEISKPVLTEKVRQIAADLARVASERAGLGQVRERVASLSGAKESLLAAAADFAAGAAVLKAAGQEEKLRKHLLRWLEWASFDKASRELTLRINPGSGMLLLSDSRTR
jgi:DNA invertase Pin-like site-specific DNA recombinase